MVEFIKMQNCFTRYPKLYGNNNHSNKTNEKENDVESIIKPMNHPEARRYRMNEARKKNNQS
jgi:hypothetical protein